MALKRVAFRYAKMKANLQSELNTGGNKESDTLVHPGAFGEANEVRRLNANWY
ncbi:MAG: hypothetical protein H7844_13265 [Nitrospirae bacterium YQR-1]